jgi:hypothetical protein
MEIVALLVAAQLAQATVSPAAHCTNLIAYYDRYAVGAATTRTAGAITRALPQNSTAREATSRRVSPSWKNS